MKRSTRSPRRPPADTRHQTRAHPLRRPALQQGASFHACLTTNEGNRVAVPVQYTPDLDRTFLIPRLTGTQGWTVFEIPSTQGRDFAYRPPLAVDATLPPPHAVACWSTAASREYKDLLFPSSMHHGSIKTSFPFLHASSPRTCHYRCPSGRPGTARAWACPGPFTSGPCLA